MTTWPGIIYLSHTFFSSEFCRPIPDISELANTPHRDDFPGANALMWFLETSKCFPLKSKSGSRKWLSVNHFHQHFLEHRTPPELQIHCFSVSGNVHVIPAQYFWVPFMDLSNARSLIILIFVRIQLKMNVRYQVTVLYILPKLWCLQRNRVSCWPWFLALDPSMK